MKLKVNVSAVISLGVTLLLGLGTVGCTSSGTQTRITPNTQSAAGGARQYAQASLARVQSWGGPRGSVVSPLGDAPGERDLELRSE